LLQHLKEAEEPFEQHQAGSSAMPYKRNPMRSERLPALARFVITGEANAAHTAATQWLERSLDDSANRRLALAEGFLAADAILTLYENIVSSLVVYPKMMEKNLLAELPFMATENILMKAVMKGGDRQELHERIRSHAMQAGKQVKEEGRPNDLLARIAQDPAFGLSQAELDTLLQPMDYVGRAVSQTEEYITGEAAVLLAPFSGEEGLSAEISL